MADHERSNIHGKDSVSAVTNSDPGPKDGGSTTTRWPLLNPDVAAALRKLVVVGLLLAIFRILIDPKQPTSPLPLKHQTSHASWSHYPQLQAGARAAKPWLQLTRRQAPSAGGNASTPPLQTFSVDVPLLGLDGTVVGAGTPAGFAGIETSLGGVAAVAGCQITLGVNVFVNSFGAPFVGNYTPPACIGDSNSVVMNLTVQSQGRQFDRLAIV